MVVDVLQYSTGFICLCNIKSQIILNMIIRLETIHPCVIFPSPSEACKSNRVAYSSRPVIQYQTFTVKPWPHYMWLLSDIFACCQNRKLFKSWFGSSGSSVLQVYGHFRCNHHAANPCIHIAATPHCVLLWPSDDLEVTVQYWTISQLSWSR